MVAECICRVWSRECCVRGRDEVVSGRDANDVMRIYCGYISAFHRGSHPTDPISTSRQLDRLQLQDTVRYTQ